MVVDLKGNLGNRCCFGEFDAKARRVVPLGRVLEWGPPDAGAVCQLLLPPQVSTPWTEPEGWTRCVRGTQTGPEGIVC